MPVRAKSTPEEREQLRLQKEPFKTMIDPDMAETLDHLRGWIPPLKNAYVLWEAHVIHTRDEGVFERGTRLLTMDVEYQPEQFDQINHYLGKGFKILHYANFPRFNDHDQERARKAVMYSQGKGKSPWDELQVTLERQMRRGVGEREALKLRQENDALKAMVAKYQNQIEAEAKPEKSEKLEKAGKGGKPGFAGQEGQQS